MGAAMIGSAVVFGTLSGGLNASQEQHEINDSACEYFKLMQDYIEISNGILSDDAMLIATYKKNIFAINDQLADLSNKIREKRKSFRTKYNLYIVILFIFIALIIFALVSKKVIFKAHTE